MERTVGYTLLELPFGLSRLEDLSTRPRNEAKAFLEWFLAQVPLRLQALSELVCSSPGCAGWQPDYTRKAVEQLGNWFAEQLETRPYTQEEMEAVYGNQLAWALSFGAQKWRLTERATSIALDVSIYMADVITHLCSDVQWTIEVSRKDHAFYQQPVLKGAIGYSYPYPAILIIFGEKIAKKETPQHLLFFFDSAMNAFAPKRVYTLVWGEKAYVLMPSEKKPGDFYDMRPVVVCPPRPETLAAALDLVLCSFKTKTPLEEPVAALGFDLDQKAIGVSKADKMIADGAVCCGVIWRCDGFATLNYTPRDKPWLPIIDEEQATRLPVGSSLQTIAGYILAEVDARKSRQAAE